jgi:CspA family cold shock protein
MIVAAKQTGTVKSYNGSNGYGFIKPDGGGTDVFVHHTALPRLNVSVLKEGQRLGFALCKETQGKHTGRVFADELERV